MAYTSQPYEAFLNDLTKWIASEEDTCCNCPCGCDTNNGPSITSELPDDVVASLGAVFNNPFLAGAAEADTYFSCFFTHDPALKVNRDEILDVNALRTAYNEFAALRDNNTRRVDVPHEHDASAAQRYALGAIYGAQVAIASIYEGENVNVEGVPGDYFVGFKLGFDYCVAKYDHGKIAATRRDPLYLLADSIYPDPGIINDMHLRARYEHTQHPDANLAHFIDGFMDAGVAANFALACDWQAPHGIQYCSQKYFGGTMYTPEQFPTNVYEYTYGYEIGYAVGRGGLADDETMQEARVNATTSDPHFVGIMHGMLDGCYDAERDTAADDTVDNTVDDTADDAAESESTAPEPTTSTSEPNPSIAQQIANLSDDTLTTLHNATHLDVRQLVYATLREDLALSDNQVPPADYTRLMSFIDVVVPQLNALIHARGEESYMDESTQWATERAALDILLRATDPGHVVPPNHFNKVTVRKSRSSKKPCAEITWDNGFLFAGNTANLITVGDEDIQRGSRRVVMPLEQLTELIDAASILYHATHAGRMPHTFQTGLSEYIANFYDTGFNTCAPQPTDTMLAGTTLGTSTTHLHERMIHARYFLRALYECSITLNTWTKNLGLWTQHERRALTNLRFI